MYLVIFVFGVNQQKKRQGKFKIPLYYPVAESFFPDLPGAIISYWAESHLESCQTSTMDLSSENKERL